MRIALTVDPELPVPPALYGGIERIVDMLARGLAERGHDVTLFAHPDSTCPVRKVAWPGARSTSRVDSLQNAMTLSRHVLTGQFDIVHSFSRLFYMLPLLPLPVPKLMSYSREVARHTSERAWKLSRGTLHFSVLAEHMRRHVTDFGRWHLIPNGVPMDTYAFRGEVAPDAPLVFVGRVEEVKGPHLAIEIARRTGRRLVIAGNIAAEHQGWFDQNIAPHLDDDRVRYVGPVNDAQKNALMGEAAAFLMPILWEEPFGLVMAEAMACGTPVIGLGRGAVPEVVEHGVTGFVCDSVEEMVAALSGIGRIDRRACRARVDALYSDRAFVETNLRVYRLVAASRAAA